MHGNAEHVPLPCVPTFSQSEWLEYEALLRKGFNTKEAALLLNVSAGRLRKYLRIHSIHGIEAFAEG